MFSHFWPTLVAEHSPFFLSLRENFSNVELTANYQDADVIFYSIFGDAPFNIDPTKHNFLYIGESEQYVKHTFFEKYNAIISKVNLIGQNPENDAALSNFRFTEWMWQINWFNVKNSNETFLLKEINQNRNSLIFRKNRGAFVSRYSNHDWLTKRFDFVELIQNAGINIDKYGFEKYLAPGYRKKVKKLKQYRLQLPFENNISPGYVTEKLFHGLLAGGLNLYFGDDYAKKDFNPIKFIHFKNIPELEQILDSVKSKISSNKYLKQINAEPIFLTKPSIDGLINHFYKICK